MELNYKLAFKILFLTNFYFIVSESRICVKDPARNVTFDNGIRLNISDCEIDTFSLDTLDAENFTEIVASVNNLTKLETNAFVQSPNLMMLTFFKNSIAEIHVDAFAGLMELKNLTLSMNKISKLEVGVFSCLENLEFLWLAGNDIKILPADIFEKNSNLKCVNIIRNKIIGIDMKFMNPGIYSELVLEGNICINDTIKSNETEKLKTCFIISEIHDGLMKEALDLAVQKQTHQCTTPTPSRIEPADDLENIVEQEDESTSVESILEPIKDTTEMAIALLKTEQQNIQNEKSSVLYGIIIFLTILVNVLIIYIFKIKSTNKDMNHRVDPNEVIKRQSAMQIKLNDVELTEM